MLLYKNLFGGWMRYAYPPYVICFAIFFFGNSMPYVNIQITKGATRQQKAEWMRYVYPPNYSLKLHLLYYIR